MSPSSTAHLDTRRNVPERVWLLMEQMTLREKCFQLTSVAPWSIVSPTSGLAEEAAEFLAKSPGHIADFVLDARRRTRMSWAASSAR